MYLIQKCIKNKSCLLFTYHVSICYLIFLVCFFQHTSSYFDCAVQIPIDSLIHIFIDFKDKRKICEFSNQFNLYSYHSGHMIKSESKGFRCMMKSSVQDYLTYNTCNYLGFPQKQRTFMLKYMLFPLKRKYGYTFLKTNAYRIKNKHSEWK